MDESCEHLNLAFILRDGLPTGVLCRDCDERLSLQWLDEVIPDLAVDDGH